MSQNQPAGRGALFKNDKQGVEKRPDYTGTARIFGKEFTISAWIQTSRYGLKYLGFVVNEKHSSFKEDPQEQTVKPTNDLSAPPAKELDDSIPF